tara:strand:- start:6135 stop:6368 length:234 start_codon:yes stop_codon:yes gene_type:complete
MFDSGVDNQFEEAHQKGLHRGFDLGWSYKGRYYRQIVRDMLNDKDYLIKSGEGTLKRLLKKMERDKDNRENITINSW